MPKDKKEILIKRAIEEFFFMFPECEENDFDWFIVTKSKTVYRVELTCNGKSYVRFMAE